MLDALPVSLTPLNSPPALSLLPLLAFTPNLDSDSMSLRSDTGIVGVSSISRKKHADLRQSPGDVQPVAWATETETRLLVKTQAGQTRSHCPHCPHCPLSHLIKHGNPESDEKRAPLHVSRGSPTVRAAPLPSPTHLKQLWATSKQLWTTPPTLDIPVLLYLGP